MLKIRGISNVETPFTKSGNKQNITLAIVADKGFRYRIGAKIVQKQKVCDKNRGAIGLSLFWGFVGLGDILRGEKGERKN